MEMSSKLKFTLICLPNEHLCFLQIWAVRSDIFPPWFLRCVLSVLKNRKTNSQKSSAAIRILILNLIQQEALLGIIGQYVKV